MKKNFLLAAVIVGLLLLTGCGHQFNRGINIATDERIPNGSELANRVEKLEVADQVAADKRIAAGVEQQKLAKKLEVIEKKVDKTATSLRCLRRQLQPTALKLKTTGALRPVGFLCPLQ